MSSMTVLLTQFLLALNLFDQSLQLSECQFADNATNPCVHGICLSVNSSQSVEYQCYCENGFTGTNCHKRVYLCLHHNPCQNNAKCVDSEGIPDVECVCEPSYCGKYCEHEVNECLSTPCLNGGRCLDKVGEYECLCLEGFKGKNCEIDENVCPIGNSSQLFSRTKCLNGGTCVEGPGLKYFCACDQGHTGPRCEYKVRHCESNPCLNGGRCDETDEDEYYRCVCGLDWTGKQCDVRLVECQTNICDKNAICMQTNETKPSNESNTTSRNETTVCYCLPDFYGAKCEHRYDDCTPNPCLNDGICIDGIDSYECNCSETFTGGNCQIDCSDPLNEQLCVLPTTASVDLSSQTFSIDITPSFPVELTPTFTIEFPSTPLFNESEIIEPTSGSVFTTPYPQMTTIVDPITPSAPIVEPSPTVDFNATLPPTVVSPETKIFVPRLNGYNSSIIFRSKRNKRNFISISLDLKSEESITGSVPVLYSKNRHNHELLIYVKNDSLNLMIANRTEKLFSIQTNMRITAKVFNKISVELSLSDDNKSLKFLVALNDTKLTAGRQDVNGNYSKQLCSFDLFYFGAIPWIFDKIFTPKDIHFLKGCLKSVFINDNELYLSDAITRSGISECLTDASEICAHRPCRNGGLCRTDGQHWHCLCADGYRSDLCERAHCTPDLCHNQGICLIPDERHYLCVCPLGWTGLNCQIKTPTMSSFNLGADKSYVKYNVKNLTNHLEIKFRFATKDVNQSKALILFMSNETNDTNETNYHNYDDFIAVTLDATTLAFTINLGQGIRTLYSPITHNLTEQLIFFGHHNQFVWLIVIPEESQPIHPIISRTPHSFHVLNVTNHLYVGGHPSFSDPFQKRHPFISSLTGFKGCIYDIEIRTNLNIEFEALSNESVAKSVNVGVCDIVDDCYR